MKRTRKPKKPYGVGSKYGMSGVVMAHGVPRHRKQDKRFKTDTFYAVVFFPKVASLGQAVVLKPDLTETLSASPAVARAKWLDGLAKGETWNKYRQAGWMVRRIKISDLGPAS